MRSTRHRLLPRAAAAALCVLAACAPAARAQAPPPVGLVAALEEYEGPSTMAGRPALVAFSPDGRTLAISGAGRSVRLYDAATGKLLRVLAGGKEGFNGFAFAPDSRAAATRSARDRSVTLWDLSTGNQLARFAGRERDLETKFKAALTLTTEFTPVPFSPDGRVLLTEREDDLVAAWGVADGGQLFTLEHKTETNAAGDVLSVFLGGSLPLILTAEFAPDGARLVTANGDQAPKLWDAATGRLVAALKCPARTYRASFLPAAVAVVTVSYRGEIDLWDAATGAHRAALAGERGDRHATALARDAGPFAASDDGRLVAAQFKDETKVWDAASGKEVASFRNKARLLAFGAGGRVLVTAGGDKRATGRVWDAASGALRATLAAPDADTRSLRLSPDGRHFATTSDKSVRVWETETGQLVATLDKARFPVRFSPDGRRLVTGGTDKTAYLYELTP